MNVRELIDILSDEIDPETVVAIYDGDHFRHIRMPMVEQFAVSFLLGSIVPEEDVS
jgi:hypothetical protein